MTNDMDDAGRCLSVTRSLPLFFAQFSCFSSFVIWHSVFVIALYLSHSPRTKSRLPAPQAHRLPCSGQKLGQDTEIHNTTGRESSADTGTPPPLLLS